MAEPAAAVSAAAAAPALAPATAAPVAAPAPPAPVAPAPSVDMPPSSHLGGSGFELAAIANLGQDLDDCLQLMVRPNVPNIRIDSYILSASILT
jgi:hypothetical protein